MAEAQKLRYSKLKGETQSLTPSTPEAPKTKRKISADGLKRIAAAQRQRWAAKKAAEAVPAKKVAVKKTAVKKTVTKKVTPVKKAASKKSAAKKTAPAPAVA
jgi:hypothetical protein